MAPAGRRAPLGLAVALAACAGAPPTFYQWNGYSERLYAHYRAPQQRQAWVEGLKIAILEVEQRGGRMPPGLYAEYGYALLEEGQARQAAVYFEKEAALWPEARLLMEKLIRVAGQRAPRTTPPATGPAGALERG